MPGQGNLGSCGQAPGRYCARCMRCATGRQFVAAQEPVRQSQQHQGSFTAAPRSTAVLGKNSPRPTDVVYLYDGSIPGFFCCVYESVYARELPADIQPELVAQPTLFRQKLIETNPEKAQRVAASIPKKISPRAMELVQSTFLTCLEHKEMALLRFLLLGYREGNKTPWLFGHPDVAPLLAAEKHMMGETHLLKGFVRFSDYDGVLVSVISPKNFVLPFLEPHFTARFSGEDLMIFDKTHKAALIYEKGASRIIPLESVDFPKADEQEENYRALWKQFFKTIAIEERTNPRCQRTHMPKRYWENMTEMKDAL